MLNRSVGPLWLALAGCLLLALAFPGDTPWINDEPVLIWNALEADAQGILAKEGLLGSVGIRYSPLPTWVYQGLLLVSKNPVHLSLIKNALTLCMLLGGLLFLSHRLGLSPWPLLLVCLSPYIYLYSRLLWDNVMMIPLSLMVWCTAADFWQRKNRWSLATAGLLSVILIHIHMMAVLLIVPLGLTLVILDRRWFREHLYFTSGLIAALVLAALPYLLTVLQGTGFSESARDGLLDSLLAGAKGAAYFSFLGFGDYFLPEIHGRNFFLFPALTDTLVGLGGMVHVFFLFGLIGGVSAVARKIGNGHEWNVHDRLMTLALIVILSNIVFFGVTRHPHHPHYYNAVWFAYFYVIWRGLDRGFRKASHLARTLFSTCGAALAAMLILVILFVHINGGNRRVHYGPTLANQIEVAQTILRHSPRSSIYNFVPNYEHFPHALYTLLRLFGSSFSQKDRPDRHIYLYHGQDPDKGRIYVKTAERPLDLKSGFENSKSGDR